MLGPALFWAWDYACFSTTLLADAAGPLPAAAGAAFLVSQASVLAAAWALRAFPEKTPGLTSTPSVMVSSALLALFSAMLAFMRPESAAEGALLVAAAVAAGGALPPLAIAWGARQTLCHSALMPTVAGSFLLASLLFAPLLSLPRDMAALACALPAASAALLAIDGRRRRRRAGTPGDGLGAAAGEGPVEAVDGDTGGAPLPWPSLLSLAALSFICELAARGARRGGGGAPLFGVALCLLFCLALLLLSGRSARLGKSFAPARAVYALIPLAAAALAALPYAPAAALADQALHGVTIAVQAALWTGIAGETERRGLSPVSSFGAGLVAMSAATLASELLAATFMALAPGAFSACAAPTSAVALACMATALAWASERKALASQAGPREDAGSPGALAALQEAVDARVGLLAEAYGLTPREREVLGHLLQGSTAPHIGELMGLTTGTVKSHVNHIYRKLGVSSRQQAADLFKSFEGKA